MKSLPRLTFAVMLLPASGAFAADADVYRELLRYRIQNQGTHAALNYTTPQFLAQVLKDPQSPYSDPVEAPEFTNEIWWDELVSGLSLDSGDTFGEALRLLQKQTGLTKARPGIEINVPADAERMFRGREAAANALKAGIDADIFYKAWDMKPPITVAAGQALALQIHRTQVENLKASVVAMRGPGAVPTRSDYERNALDPDLVPSYLAAVNSDALKNEHLVALASSLSYMLEQPTGRVERGTTQLPAAYRVARIAAAYSDASGGYSAAGFCHNGDVTDAERKIRGDDAFDYARPLCFVGATDRAVHHWFRGRVRQDAQHLRIHDAPHHALGNALHWLGIVMILADLMPFVEATDAAAMSDLAHEGAAGEADAELASQRYQQLQCRIQP